MEQFSIGQVKRDISTLVNRVAYGGERIVLTSRGKPKAALVSIEDYQRLRKDEQANRRQRWQAWLASTETLTQKILDRRRGAGIDVDELLRHDRRDLEARGD